MFKKLKRRFVVVNMAMLTIVLVVIFVVIYILTAATGERQINLDLQRLMDSPPAPAHGEPNMATNLIIDLDLNGEIVKLNTYVNIEEDDLDSIINYVINSKKDRGKVSVGEYSYSFLVKDTLLGKRIVLVDREPLKQNLYNLLTVFLFTGMVSLILLFLVSLMFANRSIKPIKEAFEKQQQFIADASHELKTPLTIIKTNLAVIKENETQTVESQSKWLGFIQSQADRMSSLINDMLSLAKMDFSDQKIIFEEFNISKTVEGVLLLFEAAAFENGIRLDKDIQTDIFYIGSKEGIERIVNILMDNAIKNTPSGGNISVSLSKVKSNVKLIVKNSGEGISTENIEKIFERFYRVDDSRSRKRGGFGLGLAIAKSIVEYHHGKIYATSNEGIDVSFVVELPRNKIISN